MKIENDMDRFFQGFTDACLMAQNVVNAAESLGLGTVYYGSILNNPSRTIKLLKLPKRTFPVLGLGFGYPNQEPQLKPRMDMKLRMFENSYKCFDNYSEIIKEYDEIMQTYYDLRQANKRVDSFSNQVVSKLKNVNPLRQRMVDSIIEQGFFVPGTRTVPVPYRTEKGTEKIEGVYYEGNCISRSDPERDYIRLRW